MKVLSKTRRAIFWTALLLGTSSLGCSACGLNWSVPHSHFDGVDERGKVSWWQKIGSVDLGEGLSIPLIVGFESGNNTPSPYLGDGWTLALLDSHIVQIDTNRFLMVQPDGWTSRFGRKNDTDTTLIGQKGWLASINGNQITVWAKCGWKMVFTDGKITSITTPFNQELNYAYGPSGVVEEIDINGAPVLTVNSDSAGLVNGLTSNGKQIAFSWGSRPAVETINGQNVVSEMKPSLNQLTFPDGTTENFKFAVNSSLEPILNISGRVIRDFAWNSQTGLISKDGTWLYNNIAGQKLTDNAQVQRTNQFGQSEYWFDDEHNRQEITSSDGIKTIKRWFASGVARGKIRSIDEIRDGTTKRIYMASYNEIGQLIRESCPSFAKEFEYAQSGAVKVTTTFPSGLTEIKEFTHNNALSSVGFFKGSEDLLASASPNSTNEAAGIAPVLHQMSGKDDLNYNITKTADGKYNLQ